MEAPSPNSSRDPSQLGNGDQFHVDGTHSSDQVALRTGLSLLAPGIARNSRNREQRPAQKPDGHDCNRTKSFDGTTTSRKGSLSPTKASACEGLRTASKTVLRPLPPLFDSHSLSMSNSDLCEQLASAHARIAELEHNQQAIMSVLQAVTSHIDLDNEDFTSACTRHEKRLEHAAEGEDRSHSPIPKILRRTGSASRGHSMPNRTRSGGSSKIWPEDTSAGQKDTEKEYVEGANGSTSRDGGIGNVVAPETFKDKEGYYVWTSCSSNAYGAFIHVALQAGIWKALKLTLPMVLVSTLVQAVFSFQLLWTHWNDFSRETQRANGHMLCDTPWLIQTCATGIFATLMLNNVGGMWKAVRLALLSTHHAGGDGETLGKYKQTDMGNKVMPIVQSLSARVCIFIFGVFLEMATWALLSVAGIVWINSASDVDLVIRSTVSVMFVLNVDELIYEACCMSDIITDVEETKYRVLDLNPNFIQTRISASFKTTHVVRSIVFSGHDLAARDSSLVHGRTSDAYLVLYQDGEKVGKTAVVPHNLNPTWPQLTVKFKTHGHVVMKCFDYDVITKDDFIGEARIPVADLQSAAMDGVVREYQLKDKQAEHTGRVRIQKIEDASLIRVSSWFVVKHFVDVYLYLFFLIGLSVGVTAAFKQVILEDCSLASAKLW